MALAGTLAMVVLAFASLDSQKGAKTRRDPKQRPAAL
jgi:hypothetical protein